MTTRSRTKPSRRFNFTERGLAALKPEAHAVDWTDTDATGLSLRVAPGGSKAFYLLFKFGGTLRRKRLGAFPALTLTKARDHVRRDRLRIDDEHVDVASERLAEKAEAHGAFTVGDLCALYLTAHAKQFKKSWKDDHWRIEQYILPAWRTRGVRDISRSEVHALLDKIIAANKPIQANRVQALVSKLWNFAVDREHATVNVAYRMAKRSPERVRSTTLNDDAIRSLWTALDATPGDAADAVRLRLLLGQRGGEVHGMKWADVDLDAAVWMLPATSAKNKRVHSVPLSAPALAILTTRLAARVGREVRIFPGLYHQRKNLRALAAIHDGAYRWHDLRRVVATRLAALGYHDDVIGRVLNHAKVGITARVYNVHQFDREKRQALDAWANELQRIVTETPKTAATVVPIKRGRR